MASKSIFKKISSKLIWVLTVLCIICTSAFFFTACNNAQTEVEDPTYSFTEDNKSPISNGNFNIGTSSLDFTTLSSLPRISVTGWTKDSSLSDVNSGVIDVSTDGWKALISKLYDDSDFLAYAKSAFGVDKDVVAEQLKQEGKEKPTSKEIKDKIIEDYFTDKAGQPSYFPNPGKASDSDNKVYMLNNYDKDSLGHGVSQKITSSSNIKLEKGNYGKFTVSIQTISNQYLKHYGSTDNYGAFIAINNTFNSSSQAQYSIKNIKTDGKWETYTIYVKADKAFDTSVTLVLGLGSDDYSAVEGTAYFDNIEFAHVTEEEYNKAVADGLVINDTKTMVYAYKDNPVVAYADNNDQNNYYLYDMSFNKYLFNGDNETIKNVSDFKGTTTFTVKTAKTESSTGLGNSFGPATVTQPTEKVASDLSYVIGDDLKYKEFTLDKDSYTITYSSDVFNVQPGKFVYVEFYVKNLLSKFGSTAITFDIFEDVSKTGVKDAKYKSKAVTTVSEPSDEWQKVGLIFYNNFPEGTDNRKFIIDIVLGPVDVASATTAPDYAKGSVLITDPLIGSGLIASSTEVNGEEKENDNYHMLSLLKSTSSYSLSLFGDMQQDYQENSTSESYSFTTSASDIGAITSHPASPINYTGVVSDHVYIKDNGELETIVNDRVNGDANGSYAGLVNTKYNTAYKTLGIDVNAKLNFTGKKNIQPLMIYNAVEDSYGYIGAEKTISASAKAKISVDVRVVDDAVAYIYLVDVAEKTKKVMTFDEESIKLDSPKEMIFTIDKTAMNDNGWATVTFYIATGATAKEFRIELWNGDRDGAIKSQGYVFFNDVKITTTDAFNEPESVNNAFTVAGNPLYDIGLGGKLEQSVIEHTQALTDDEIRFNAIQTDSSKVISYKPTIIWANDDTNIYAIYKTIDPVVVDPFDTEDSTTDTSSGCTAQTNSSAFWLSFSSILLGVVLVLAIIMLILKNVRRKRKANASDAKSHYKVVSRSRIYKPTAKEQPEEQEDIEEIEEIVEEEPIQEEVEEEPVIDIDDKNQSDDYIYGDVQDFGDDDK